MPPQPDSEPVHRPRSRRWAAVSSLTLAVAVIVAGCASGPSLPPLPGVGTLPAGASAWPAAGDDARHSSATKAVGPQHGRPRWVQQLTGNLTPGPVVGIDGSILAASNNGTLSAREPRSGAEVWKFDGGGFYGSDLSTSPAVLGDGTILWPGPADTLFALSASGRLQWREAFAGQVLSPAVAGHDRVYVADLAGHLTALEVHGNDHRKVWSVDVGGPNYASATVGPDGTIFTASGKNLIAVTDLGERARIRWRHKTRSLVEVSNAVSASGIVILGTNGDDEYGITSSGKVAWKFAKGDYTYSSSIAAPNGLAYFGDNQGRLTVLSSADGSLQQRSQGSSEPRMASTWTQPVVDARGDYYFATQSGHVYGFAPDGRQLFDYLAAGAINSYPALDADGTLYLGTITGQLVALDPS